MFYCFGCDKQLTEREYYKGGSLCDGCFEYFTNEKVSKKPIKVVRNQDGTHTAKRGKQSHTTRKMQWD